MIYQDSQPRSWISPLENNSKLTYILNTIFQNENGVVIKQKMVQNASHTFYMNSNSFELYSIIIFWHKKTFHCKHHILGYSSNLASTIIYGTVSDVGPREKDNEITAEWFLESDPAQN